MATNEPITLSMAWNLDQDVVKKIGVIDVTLNCDTNLFIDPLLLAESANKDFRECASAAYEARFIQLIELLTASKEVDDIAWRAAKKRISFHEIGYTHLGYSSGTGGSGFGEKLAQNLLTTAKEVIGLGVTNPNLFVALALFEDGVGADRISDMTTNIIIECLARFTASVCTQMKIGTQTFDIKGSKHELPVNPIKPSEPILLVPADIVRDLPIASDWSSVSAAARETEELRERVNSQIGEIWKARTRREKDDVLNRALQSKKTFDTLLDLISYAADEPYDIKNDHRGEIYPANIRRNISKAQPLDLVRFSNRALNLSEVDEIVCSIINQFKSLIEDRGLWKELWDDKQENARLEKAMQRLFYAVALSYCDANNLDISPESDGGAGPVDFKVSNGANSKVLLELKRSTNSKLVDAYTKQLDAYRAAEGTTRAYYVVIDIGNLTPMRIKQLSDARSVVIQAGLNPSEIVFIDGNVQKSASKR
ncbi:hypothetical protein [Achromobacter insolitus]|uniref:hypothetical protein n=1 Tax=Achromobacter insolitus TaxID=217204 RepID=UPI00174DBF11|nr:hypothetical protein [Achromobacter insolitus]